MSPRKFIGAHVSIAGGVENAPLRAGEIGANAFAMFTKNQRQWQAKPLTGENIARFRENLAASGIKPEHVLPHDGYLINLGNPDREKRNKSLAAFIDEATRVEQLGLHLLNFHPGSHLRRISEQECIALIAQGIDTAIDETARTIFVLETTAGQGSNIGYTFAQLAAIIESVKAPERMGVCIDTCHIYAAGYDLKENYEKVMEEFAGTIGFDRLKGVHLNDSKARLGRKLDRHHSIGRGELGIGVFEMMMKDSRFDNIPMVLETIDSSLWPEEIAMLSRLAG